MNVCWDSPAVRVMLLYSYPESGIMKEAYPYPVFLNLQGKQCLVAGGGVIATRKVNDLVEAGAKVTVIAEQASIDIEKLAADGTVDLSLRRWEKEDISGMFLVFAATDDKAVNAEIAVEARQNGVIVNAVDDPPLCDFISAATIKRGPLKIAVSTSGRCPKMAAVIRRDIETQFSENYGDFIETVGELRKTLLASEDMTDQRRLDALAWLCGKDAHTIYEESGKEGLWQQLHQIIST